MRVINSITGFALLALAVLHVFIPKTPILSLIYLGGALLALASLRVNLSFAWARVLAVATVIAMFFYFAAFFRIVDHFHEQWYRSGMMLEAVGMLISAFAMIPVLSVYSCSMKSEGQAVSVNERAIFACPEENANADQKTQGLSGPGQTPRRV
jgi:heme/copper-type cytochrome/quinol oxidase subunit 2